MSYSKLSDIGLSETDELKPVTILEQVNPEPITTNTNNLQYNKIIFDNEQRVKNNYNDNYLKYLYEEDQIKYDQKLKDLYEEDQIKYDQKLKDLYEEDNSSNTQCEDIFDHIMNCSLCKKIYKDKSAGNMNVSNDPEPKKDKYKKVSVLLGCLCIILFLIILKLLIR